MWGRLDQLRLVSGERLELRLVARAPTGSGAAVVEVVAAGRRTEYVVPSSSTEQRLVVTGAGAELPGPAASATSTAAPIDALEVRVLVPPGTGTSASAAQRLPLRPVGAEVELLAPAGPTWTTGPVAPALLELSLPV